MTRTIDMLDAKSQLSKLVQSLEDGRATEIVITRNGRPAARLVAVDRVPAARRQLGLAKGRFTVPDDFDADNDLIVRLLTGEAD